MVEFLILQPEVLRFDSPLGYKVQLGEGQFRKKSRNDVLTYYLRRHIYGGLICDDRNFGGPKIWRN